MTSKGAIDVKPSGWMAVAVVLVLAGNATDVWAQFQEPGGGLGGRGASAGPGALPPGNPAETDDPRIDLDVRGMAMNTVLRRLEEHFGVELAPVDDAALETPITVALRGATVEEALLSVLVPHGLVAVKAADGYLIRPRRPGDDPQHLVEKGVPRIPLSECAQALLQGPDDTHRGLRLDEDQPQFRAIESLTEMGSPEAVAVLQEFLTTHDKNRKLKMKALASLGRIGSVEAVEAVGTFEEWAASRYADPPPWRFGPMDYAVDHFGGLDIQPLATCDGDGDEWAIFRWRKFEQTDLWATHSLGEGLWDEPVLLEIGEGTRPWYEGTFRLSRDGEQFAFSTLTIFDLSLFLQDEDEDGLPDRVEIRMPTQVRGPDTDQDGTPDGEDSNPLTPGQAPLDDAAQIRQAVFSIMFATSNCRQAIWVIGDDEWTEQEYLGYMGPVLRAGRVKEGLVNVTDISVELTSPTTATATIQDWEGMLAAGGHVAELVKIHGKWVVTEFQMTWIS